MCVFVAVPEGEEAEWQVQYDLREEDQNEGEEIKEGQASESSAYYSCIFVMLNTVVILCDVHHFCFILSFFFIYPPPRETRTVLSCWSF